MAQMVANGVIQRYHRREFGHPSGSFNDPKHSWKEKWFE